MNKKTGKKSDEVSSAYGSLYSCAELQEIAEKYEHPGYIRLRTALIPLAEAHANAVCGSSDGSSKASEKWAAAWNREFHGKMEELVRERRIKELC